MQHCNIITRGRDEKTASILKQDPNTLKVHKNTVYLDKTCTFGGNLYQATTQHLTTAKQ